VLFERSHREYVLPVTAAGLRTAEALLPLTGLVTFLLGTMGVFAARCATLGSPRTAYIESREASTVWKWFMEWWVWLWGPVERACIDLGISPNSITLASTALAGVAAVLLGSGHLSLGGWIYLLAASLDLVDGRVARAQGTSSRSGAFLDSTLDRLAELLVFAGLAVHFRATPGLGAALAAAAASVMVSYTRARGEALGISGEARVGGMQRAERVVLTGVPCALAPLLDAAFGPGAGRLVVGIALSLLALVTSMTAIRRSYSIWSALRGSERQTRGAGNVRWLDLTWRRERLGR
jgi:CDP-diacylglycerol---glycerol-3-phosphate 3-phosphatidyltransferase